ncbi:MAG: DUF2853 domain-containing protein [Gammaproteobacteria bacterium]|nr:MAG: DUF2853 domain-containing protein [Gammaproteobacteria bacterium]
MVDHVADVKKYTSKVDENALNNLLKNYRLVLSKKETATVACSQPSELDTVRNNFLKKKLGLSKSDDELNAAIKEICEKMGTSNRNKSRATFYYLLAEKFGKLSVFS